MLNYKTKAWKFRKLWKNFYKNLLPYQPLTYVIESNLRAMIHYLIQYNINHFLVDVSKIVHSVSTVPLQIQIWNCHRQQKIWILTHKVTKALQVCSQFCSVRYCRLLYTSDRSESMVRNYWINPMRHRCLGLVFVSQTLFERRTDIISVKNKFCQVIRHLLNNISWKRKNRSGRCCSRSWRSVKQRSQKEVSH